MKVKSIKNKIAVVLGAVAITALAAVGFISGNNYSAHADTRADSSAYSQSYRNRLAFSAKKGWNNDPNGLLYVNGTYHMYFQYNAAEENGWGHMSWGHATSNDLVHWKEQPVALPENAQGMMFSGSAVYDEYNTSGFFGTGADGKVNENEGIVAVLTQNTAEGQTQIIAYSKDGGQSFTPAGEVLGRFAEGNGGDGDFRDPKVFWHEGLNKWLMVIGGGRVRMYSSDNLKEWKYLGDTGLWGECPDLSRFEVDGEEKYALVLSPEDKEKSHISNGTNRYDTYYPAEYYAVGELDEKGLFKKTQDIKRLSEGVDSYAFQSFNNTESGKVYGVSWSASWFTVDNYRDFREAYNGGMTVVCEMGLESDGQGGYNLTRKPVENYKNLRGEPIKTYSGEVKAGANPLAGVNADIADMEIELDFSKSAATEAEIHLRASDAERITLGYDVKTHVLSLDRSKSSLLAKNTYFYQEVFEKEVAPENGKLSLRILSDRAFISVFANGGKASFFSAVFPSAVSNGMRLLSDGDISAKINVYPMNGIYGNVTEDKLIITAEKVIENEKVYYKADTLIGKTYPIIASSFSDTFAIGDVTYEVTGGGDKIDLRGQNGIIYVTPRAAGEASFDIKYKGASYPVKIYVYSDGLSSNVEFYDRFNGYTYVNDKGLVFAVNGSDAFLFAKQGGEDFEYGATFSPQGGAQAAGLAFGCTGNLSGYWFLTADVKENALKLVRYSYKDGNTVLAETGYNFGGSRPYKLKLVMCGGELKVYVNGESSAALIKKVDGYKGGRVGLNVFNSSDESCIINDINFRDIRSGENAFYVDGKVIKVINVTDGSYRLKESEYSFSAGILTLSDGYLETLEDEKEYVFRIFTDASEYNVTLKTDFAAAELIPFQDGFRRDSEVKLKVTGGVEVKRLEVDGRVCEFTQTGDTILLSADFVKSLAGGTYTVKAYTAGGRPTVEITVLGKDDFAEEEVEGISRTFLYLDIGIFSALIVIGVAAKIVGVALKRRKG